jgi:TolA-binding protein/uncharacterized protein YifE (UPF0438 family)
MTAGGRTLALAGRGAWFVLLILLYGGEVLGGEIPNRLNRMEITPGEHHTRMTFILAQKPRYSTTFHPGRGMRLTFMDTSGPGLKKFRSYADRHVADVRVSDRGDRLVVAFAVRENDAGFRILDGAAPNVLILDVGTSLRQSGAAAMPPGRERIWNGAGKLVREFSLPLKSELPFFPTPGPLIRKLLPAGDVQTFLRGEEALYRERGAEAEEVFTSFLNRDPSVRAIAAYRLGEAQYLLQKYESALRWFREGERLWPAYMVESPSIVFCFADSLARCGESERGRAMFQRLIIGMADTKYGPLLLVRMADIMARGGREMDAVAIYRTVAVGFSGTRASLLASIRLADRSLFAVNRDDYQTLAREYKRIHTLAGESGLKEEALFKWALLEALYGPLSDAVDAVGEYQRKFPAGIFANVVKTMREELLVSRYHELDRAGDCRGLARLALDNRGYLALCAGERQFIHRISECFQQHKMLREELDLFSSLVETEWAGENTRFLYYRIIEDAWTLGDLPLAAAASRVFLSRFSNDSMAGLVRERLGRLHFRNGEMSAVYATLSPLLGGKNPPSSPESYYYLGKACERLRDVRNAEKSMGLFLASSGNRTDSALAADARMVVASTRLARRDFRGAKAVYRNGYEASSGEQREMFLYKLGEAGMSEGKRDEARSCWERLLKEGRDPVWRSMAVQALADLSWREALERAGTSK